MLIIPLVLLATTKELKLMDLRLSIFDQAKHFV